MKIRVSSVPVCVGLALSAILASSSVASASTISLNTDPTFGLANVSFQLGNQADGCPNSWVCSTNNGTAEWTTNAPSSAQYPQSLPGDPNGLPAGQFVPSGSMAAITPVIGSTSTITQNLTGKSWASGNDYTLAFWLGNPLGGDFPDTFTVSFLTGATSPSSMCDSDTGRSAKLESAGMTTKQTGQNSPCQFSLTSAADLPSDGDWRLYLFTFHDVGLNAGTIGVQFATFNVGSAGNGDAMNLDMVGATTTTQDVTPVPEPTSMVLLGTGLVTALARRRRAAQRTR